MSVDTSSGVNITKAGTPWLILATVLLAVLKVTGKLAISWWIVALPLLLPWAILGAIIVVGIIGMLVALVVAGIAKLAE